MLLLALCLTACATVEPVESDPLPEQADQIAAGSDLQGRFAVHYTQDGKDEALHGRFIWGQTDDRTRITLLSPFGQVVVFIEVSPDEATLRQPNRPPLASTDVDSLTYEVLGWPLPVTGLYDWLKGEAEAHDQSRFVASPENNEVVTSNGWQIRYVEWNSNNSPKRIDLRRETEEAGTVQLRLVIDAL